jgi:hypothetical protein
MAEEAGVEPTEDARAPSNGFEARAPHRERYSSAAKHAAWQRDFLVVRQLSAEPAQPLATKQ